MRQRHTLSLRVLAEGHAAECRRLAERCPETSQRSLWQPAPSPLVLIGDLVDPCVGSQKPNAEPLGEEARDDALVPHLLGPFLVPHGEGGSLCLPRLHPLEVEGLHGLALAVNGGGLAPRDDVRLVGRGEQRRAHPDRVRQRDARGSRAAPQNEHLERGEEDGDADLRRRAVRVREHNLRPALFRVGVNQLHLAWPLARLREEEREAELAVEPVRRPRLLHHPPQGRVQRGDDALDHAPDAVLRAKGGQLAHRRHVHAARLQQHRRARRVQLGLEEGEPRGLGELRHMHQLQLRHHVGGGSVGEPHHRRRRQRRAQPPRHLGRLLRHLALARRKQQPRRGGRLRHLQDVPAERFKLDGQLRGGHMLARVDEFAEALAPLGEGVGGGRVQARAVEEVELSGPRVCTRAAAACARSLRSPPRGLPRSRAVRTAPTGG
mmetsp:Transcript_11693/g.37124  ORF Transcript_11693/g.37124 Transcript_11693/m.37124 type:complete len:435 (+) Transcript_11693:180-1484(+)